jgi:putative DNA primase/helicase
VLYVDGELPLQTLQERVASLISDDSLDPTYLRFLTHDAQERGLPDLGPRAGQEILRPYLEHAEVIVFDSLSTLMRSAKENEAEGWAPMQEYLLGLRRNGKSSILMHHEGKGGTQRGTSKREDILDTVIHLRRPSGYSATEGARFEIQFEKCRAMVGDSVKTIEARLDPSTCPARWMTQDIEAVCSARAIDLFEMGMSVRDVAEELGVSKSAAHRLKQKAGEVSQRPRA